MLRTMMKSKIHRATVTRAELHLVDSENRITGTGTDPAETLPGSGLVRGDALASLPR